MAEKSTTREGDSPPAPTAPVAPVAEKFSPQALIAQSIDFLGQPSYVVAGALHDQIDDLTLDDARSRIAAWLAQEA